MYFIQIFTVFHILFHILYGILYIKKDFIVLDARYESIYRLIFDWLTLTLWLYNEAMYIMVIETESLYNFLKLGKSGTFREKNV